jgi:hypothetical protein
MISIIGIAYFKTQLADLLTQLIGSLPIFFLSGLLSEKY